MKGFLQKLGFLFAVLSNVVQVQAQDKQQSRYQVIDALSKKPIVYATVILKQANRGVISDDNGNFRIPDMYKSRLDTLSISCIGFQTSLFSLSSQNNDSINIIELIPKTESLGEVTLIHENKKKQMSPGRVVKEAIRRIQENYPTQPFSYLGYYRDYQQVADSLYLDRRNITDHTYINLNEGIIQVFDAGFGTNRLTNKYNQTVLYEFQKNVDFPVDSILAKPYDNKNQKFLDGVIITPLGGNELNLLNLTNAIRNFNRMSFSFAHVFNKHFLGNHIFTHEELVFMDDEPIYKIRFILNKRNTTPGYETRGSILISKQDFGIHQLNYKLYDDLRNRLLYGINIEYKKHEMDYYLNYITFNNYFEVMNENYFKVERTVYDRETSSFYLYFNALIASSSFKNLEKHIKFFGKKKEIKILSIERMKQNVLKIKIRSTNEIEKSIFNKEVKYQVKHLKDVNGRLINTPDGILVDQFREFFVQEVFPKKSMVLSHEFVKKNAPINRSKSHSLDGKDIYWINSPLKIDK